MAKKPNPADKIIDAALTAASEQGWRRLSMRAIAEASGQSLESVLAQYPNKSAILNGFIDRVDKAMVAGGAADLADDLVRDRLFDLLMRRFDAMAPHKDGVRAIVKAESRNPCAVCLTARLGRSMALALELAGVGTAGLAGRIRTKGLLAIQLSAMRVWLGDDSEDQGRTMAHLSKSLDRADQWMARLCRRRSKPGNEATPQPA